MKDPKQSGMYVGTVEDSYQEPPPTEGRIKCGQCGMIWPDNYDATHCDCGASIDENCQYYEPEDEQ